MTNPIAAGTDDQADQLAQRTRMLKIVVVGLGVLIIVALGALVGGLIWQASKVNIEAQDGLAGPAAPIAPVAIQGGGGWQVGLDLSENVQLEAQALDGRRLIVKAVDGDKQSLWVIDVANGRVIGRIHATE